MGEASLAGRCYFVTGASSGVGLAVVRGLVARGAEVVGATRSGARGEASAGIALDLTDPASIRRAAEEFARTHAKLDGLVNAAGGLSWTPRVTAFGVDQMWALNYLGHVALTQALWPRLEAAPQARVATVAGGPVFVRPEKLDPSCFDAPPRSAIEGGSTAVTARVTWTHTLARKHPNVTALTFHPGFVRSKLFGDAPLHWRLLGRAANPFVSPDCPIAIAAAIDPQLADATGALIDPARKVHRFPALDDGAIGERLATATERLLRAY